MPRSKDPRNYGPFYDKLAETMDKGKREIKLTMSGRVAIYHRNNFYAYIDAWKHKAKSIPGDKTIDPSDMPRLLEQAMRIEDVLRRYLVVIDPEANPELPEVELRFILRGMDERQRDGIEQLDAMLADMAQDDRYLSADEVKERLSPSEFKAIDPARLRDKASPVSHFFGGVKTVVDEDMTEEKADRILSADPPDRTDLTDLITESNSPTYREEALKAANKLREKEKKES
ncbi:MAG: hypothetical protein O7D34_02145 [Ignavibacteria bacterium]|nr:hypothetical protein [Ignavibacteria bacterium]